MAKQKPSAATALVRPPVVVPPEISARPNAEAREPIYSWPSKVECPHCHRFDSDIRGYAPPVQYRKCRHASCRKTFKSLGVVIGHR